MDEDLIIRGCRNFDPYAQKCLYNYYSNVMRLVCNRYASNSEDAKDIMQEGFVKVFLNIKKYEGKGSLEGWIKRIMINTAISLYKKNAVRHEREIFENYDHSAEYSLSDDSEEETIWSKYETIGTPLLLSTIQTIAEPYRIVFNMFVFENMKHKEIGSILNIDENTSRTRLLRAKKSIKKRLEAIICTTNKRINNGI